MVSALIALCVGEFICMALMFALYLKSEKERIYVIKLIASKSDARYIEPAKNDRGRRHKSLTEQQLEKMSMHE